MSEIVHVVAQHEKISMHINLRKTKGSLIQWMVPQVSLRNDKKVSL